VADVYEPSCVTPSNTSWIVAHATEQDCLKDLGYCPWLICHIGGTTPSGLPCTVEFCMAAAPGAMCTFDYTPTYLSLYAGRPAMCEFRVSDTQVAKIDYNRKYCDSWGGTYAGPDLTRHSLFSSCYLADIKTMSDCYISSCIPDYLGVHCVLLLRP